VPPGPGAAPGGPGNFRLALRRAIGFLIVLLGAGVVAAAILERIVAADPRMTGALLAGAMAAGSTALGTLPVLFSQRISERTGALMLGFGAGVMLAASAFSLVVPALEAASGQGYAPMPGSSIVGAGILLGAGFLLLAGRLLPAHGIDAHSLLATPELRGAWLFVLAIALHNVPEGLALGVAFAADDPARAHALATGIAIQDVPEGMVVAMALRTAGMGRIPAVLLGVASGLVEPVAAVFGVLAMSASTALLPWGLAFAAGAMLFAISHDVIPGATRKGNQRSVTVALVVGFVVMMMLDTALG
jgi:ZIP family zinc transporter